MRIEILVGNGSPTYHPINKKRMLVGSDPTCDIVVSDPEVSRKHILVITEKDGYFLLDQGSTNGSYLNEEQLIPGSRVEFTTYFPVRLGASVLVSLVENEEGEVEEDNIIPIIKAAVAPLEQAKEKPAPANRNPDVTSVLTLKELKEANTQNLVKRRQSIKKKASTKKDPNKKFLTPVKMYFMAIIILGGSGYYTYLKNLEEAREAEIAQVKAKEEAKKELTPAPVVIPKVKPVTQDMVADLNVLMDVPKCTTDMEKSLCSVIFGADTQPWGVVEKENVLNVILDGKVHYEQAKSLLSPPPETKISQKARERVNTEIDLWEVALASFVSTGFKEGLDYALYAGKTLRFAFFMEESGIKVLKAYLDVTPDSLQAVKVLMVGRRLGNVPEGGPAAVSFGKDYYKLFITDQTK